MFSLQYHAGTLLLVFSTRKSRVLRVDVRVVIRTYTCYLGSASSHARPLPRSGTNSRKQLSDPNVSRLAFLSPFASRLYLLCFFTSDNYELPFFAASPGYGSAKSKCQSPFQSVFNSRLTTVVKRQSARHINHVRVERCKLPTGTKVYDRDRDLRASPLKPPSRYSTNYDVSTKSATATATRDVLPDRDPPTPSNKRKREDREDRQDAHVGYGHQQSKRTNKGGDSGDTRFPRVHTTTPTGVSSSIKTSSPFPHPLPRFILLPPPSPPTHHNLDSGHPPPSAIPIHLEDNKTPHTMHLDAHYQLPSLPCHAYRLDLSGVQSELVRTVQMRLVRTGWMLREEREERRRLERLVEAQSRVPPSSMMSMSISDGSSGEGSGSTLMDYEEDEAVNPRVWDGELKKEADAGTLGSIYALVRRADANLAVCRPSSVDNI